MRSEAILSFQIALLEDENLAAPGFARIAGGEAAHLAWHAAMDPEIASYEEAEDSYFRARASDLRDLRDRVLRHLAGEADQVVPAGVVVAADGHAALDLSGHRLARRRLVLRRGSPSSHVAILRPLARGADDRGRRTSTASNMARRRCSMAIADSHRRSRSRAARRLWQASRRAGRASKDAGLLHRAALTARGEPVRVMINVTGLAELGAIDSGEVDGIGLMRTEFLFSGRDGLPTEEEQYQIYRRMLQWAAGRPVTIRTLDAGGDKPIAGLTPEGDLNPFLGVRGVRLSLRHLDVFGAQLRALARAAVAGNLKVMIPMVTVPDGTRQCRALLGRPSTNCAARARTRRCRRSA